MQTTNNNKTSLEFNKVAYKDINLFECELTFGNGAKFIIPMRESDGWINATLLCKAGGKRFNNWYRSKETKKIIEALEKSIDDDRVETQIDDEIKVIDIHKGGNKKYEQGAWIHPDLGISLAQWISTDFSLQVSKCIRELMITNSVEIGKEKSDKELEDEYNKKIEELNNKHKQELEEALRKSEEEKNRLILEKNTVIVKQIEENKHLIQVVDRQHHDHQAYLKRKELYKLRKSPCVYLVLMRQEDAGGPYVKFGKSININQTLEQYRRSNPKCQLVCAFYTQEISEFENMLKRKYEKQLAYTNHEFIKGVPIDELKESLKCLADYVGIKYQFETEEELQKCNTDRSYEPELPPAHGSELPSMLKCGDAIHKGDRMLTSDKFSENVGNKTGRNRICKECVNTRKGGDNRKRVDKGINGVIPEHDENVLKWCNRCKTLKLREKDFYECKEKPDGLNTNCRDCRLDIKRKGAAKKLEEEGKKQPIPSTSK